MKSLSRVLGGTALMILGVVVARMEVLRSNVRFLRRVNLFYPAWCPGDSRARCGCLPFCQGVELVRKPGGQRPTAFSDKASSYARICAAIPEKSSEVAVFGGSTVILAFTNRQEIARIDPTSGSTNLVGMFIFPEYP